MYDKKVRRRRLVLAALVAASLLLLTEYFGENDGGVLHIFQRGVMAVVSPVQEGASRAAKPVRDTFSWIGDTVDAKGDLENAREEAELWRSRAIRARTAERENAQLDRLLGLQRSNEARRPVNARVIGDSPTFWYSEIWIDKGTSSGIRVDMPVVGADGRTRATGLVGRVTVAARNSARVTLITDRSVAVGVRKDDDAGVEGILQGSVGDPSLLEMQSVELDGDDEIAPGDVIVTTGTTSRRAALQSVFPPNIPVGRVRRIDDAGTDSQVVRVAPFVNMKRIEFVQVLTRMVNGNRR